MLLALAVSLTALPAAANDTPAATKSKAKTSQVSLRDVAARAAAKTTLAPPTTTTTTTATTARRADQNTSTQSTSFFKTRPGAIALAVMGVGAGYAIYSASHDKISSPAKQ